jgi:hypothetical protein
MNWGTFHDYMKLGHVELAGEVCRERADRLEFLQVRQVIIRLNASTEPFLRTSRHRALGLEIETFSAGNCSDIGEWQTL